VLCNVSPAGILQNPQGYAIIPSSIPDGTSNTILFTEKYATCNNSAFAQGGNLWAYVNPNNNPPPYYPLFGVSWTPNSVGIGSLFQNRPVPFQGNCDPTLASSPHPRGINVGLADGSVKTLSSSLTPATWCA
jgi:prepilin-type processing-associated H-X9-DG protein